MPRSARSEYSVGSFSYSSFGLTYTLSASQHTYAISEQPIPQNFDLSSYSASEDIQDAKKTSLSYGDALTGRTSGRSIAIVATDDNTLISISATSSAGTLTDINSLLTSLLPVKPSPSHR
jgi:hypothetical protein